MIYVRVELHPGGRRDAARLLQEICIANDLTGTREEGNYKVRISHATTYKGEGFRDPALPTAGETWRHGRVTGWDRGRSPAELVGRAIAAVCPWIVKPVTRIETVPAAGSPPPREEHPVTGEADLRRILEGHAWIRVKRYDPPPEATVEERLQLLEAHHQRETEFLIATCRRLAQEALDGRTRPTPDEEK